MKIKVGDTAPNVTATLKDSSGTVVDLTGATVRFRMFSAPTGKFNVNALATIVSPTAGTVRYTLQAADVDTPGAYFYEWHVTYAGGAIQHFDQRGYDEIIIQPQAPAA